MSLTPDSSPRPHKPGNASRVTPGTAWWNLEAIKAVVTIAEVLEVFGHPHGRGGRTLCPLHNGENPTAFKYDENRFHCFGCGIGGDVFDLVQRLNGCDFPTAVRYCADLAGVAQKLVSPQDLDRGINERIRQREAEAAERCQQRRRFDKLLAERREIDADVQLIEKILARDPEIQYSLTASAFRDLPDLYLRRDVLEYEIEHCERELRRWRVGRVQTVGSRLEPRNDGTVASEEGS